MKAIDIRIETTMPRNLKVVRLVKRLGNAGLGCLIRLWCNVAEHFYRDGIMVGFSSDEIEEVLAGWSGDRGEFIRACIELEFLHLDGSTYSIHQWKENQPYASARDERIEGSRKAGLASANKRAENKRPVERSVEQPVERSVEPQSCPVLSEPVHSEPNHTDLPPSDQLTLTADETDPFDDIKEENSLSTFLQGEAESETNTPTALPFWQEVANLWNEICPSLPSVLKVTEPRKRHISARKNDAVGFAKTAGIEDPLEVFKSVFVQLYDNPFNRGENDRGWTATFDYILRPDKFSSYWEKSCSKPAHKDDKVFYADAKTQQRIKCYEGYKAKGINCCDDLRVSVPRLSRCEGCPAQVEAMATADAINRGELPA